MRSTLRFVLVGVMVVVGCGGSQPAASPPAPATSTTSTPSAAPTDTTPAPAITASATSSAPAPTATAPSASAATPPPAALPASYVAAFSSLKASVDKVTAAIAAAKDCNAVADAMNAFTNDPRTSKEIAAYFGELTLLSPDQVKRAIQESSGFTDKLTTIGLDRSECTKTPRMKAALKALSTMEMGAMAPK